MKLSWLFGKNVRLDSTIYVTIDGVAFTPRGIEAVIKNLRSRNEELEAANRRFASALARARESLNNYESSYHRNVQWRKIDVKSA